MTAAQPEAASSPPEASTAKLTALGRRHASTMLHVWGADSLRPYMADWARRDLGLLTSEEADKVAGQVAALWEQIHAYDLAHQRVQAQATAASTASQRILYARCLSGLAWILCFWSACGVSVVRIRRHGAVLSLNSATIDLSTTRASAHGTTVRLLQGNRVVRVLTPDLWDEERCAALAWLINNRVEGAAPGSASGSNAVYTC